MSALTLNEKADEILLRGLLTVERVERTPAGRLIVAHCISRSNPDKVYKLGWDPRQAEYRCTCPVTGKRFCSHIVALTRVVTEVVRPPPVVQS
jgi:hypothetical protein